MTGRLRVAVVSRWYPLPERPHDGAFVEDQVRALAPGCDVDVLVPEDAPARDVLRGGTLAESGVRVVPMPRWPLALPARAAVLARALSRLTPDVGHVHLLVPDALPALAAARLRGIPVVVNEHAGFLGELARSRRARFQIVQALRRAGAIVAPSRRLAELLRTYEPQARIEVIGNPVDTDRFRPDPSSKRELALAASLNLGRPKGTDVLLRAWARAAHDAQLPPLVIVGEGAERPGYEALARDLGLEAACEFVGRMPRSELAALARRASFFVSPSRGETFGGVVAEAIASGTPVVSTRVGGAEDYVTDKVGILVEPGDEAALAEAVARMSGSAHHYDPATLHAHAERLFGFPHVRERLLELYRSLLGRPA